MLLPFLTTVSVARINRRVCGWAAIPPQVIMGIIRKALGNPDA